MQMGLAQIPSQGQINELTNAVNTLGVVPMIALLLGLVAVGVIVLLIRSAKPMIEAMSNAMTQYGKSQDRFVDVAERSTAAFEATEKAIRLQSERTVEAMDSIYTRLTAASDQAASDRKALRTDVMSVLKEYQEQVTAGFKGIKDEVGGLAKQTHDLQESNIAALPIIKDIATKLDGVLDRISALEKLVTPVPGPAEVPERKPQETKAEDDATPA